MPVTVRLLLLHNRNHVRLVEFVSESLLSFDISSIRQRLEEPTASALGSGALFVHGAAVTFHNSVIPQSAH